MERVNIITEISLKLYYEKCEETGNHNWYDTPCKQFNCVAINGNLFSKKASAKLAIYHYLEEDRDRKIINNIKLK